MRITCPFCYAQVLGTDVPLYCPHCGTKFEEADDLQPEPSRYEPYKDVSVIFRS